MTAKKQESPAVAKMTARCAL